MSRNYRRNTNAYVNGNTAVAYDGYRYNNAPQENEIKVAPVLRGKKISINPVYTFLLASVIIAVLIVCVTMLKAQFLVADSAGEIITLKNELNDIRRENANLNAIINESLDYNEIKRIAIEEYGMVYPKGNDVIEVRPTPSSYTVQYTSIELPEEQKITIGNMLAFITRGW